MNLVRRFKNSKLFDKWLFPLYIFIFYGIFVRFQGLGYSNLQGDEINPLDYLGDITGSNIPLNEFIPYLMSQKRGPMQYIINYTNTGLFGYTGEFQIRLPFFIFGVLAFISFYLLTKKIFNKEAAIWTVTFIALNGLYLAFARITQYQSFMYLTVPISILLFIKGLDKKNLLIVGASGLLLSVNLLGHYDTLSTGPFFVGYLIARLFRNKKEFSFLAKSTLVFLVFFLLPALSFYIPFLQGSYYAESTSSYLNRRLEWSQFIPLTPLILKILKVYMPIEGWMFTLFSISLGIGYLSKYLSSLNLKFFTLRKSVIKFLYLGSTVAFAISVFSSAFYFKPRASTLLFYLSSIAILAILFLSKKVKPLYIGLVFWFLFALNFYFFFMKDPRTHVYVVFIPGFIIAGYGISQFLKFLWFKKKYLFYTTWMLILILFAYLSLSYWVLYVDKSPEYPWWDKKLFGRSFVEIGRVRHQKIDGIFGFNQYRHWEEIRNLYDKGCLVGSYNSNEKNSITSFYLGFDQHNLDIQGMALGADNLIGVEGPHSWYYHHRNSDDPKLGYKLLKVFKVGGYDAIYIWGKESIYKDGKMVCN